MINYHKKIGALKLELYLIVNTRASKLGMKKIKN